jgi:hypothetical protein
MSCKSSSMDQEWSRTKFSIYEYSKPMGKEKTSEKISRESTEPIGEEPQIVEIARGTGEALQL